MAEKVVDISGLCENCDNRLVCDFIKDIKIFIRDRRSAEKIIDTNIAIYSCEKYEVRREVCSSDGICLYCSKE